MISDSLLVSSGLDFLFVAVQAGLRARPVLCGPGCGRDQCCAGRAAGETSAVRAGLRARPVLCGPGCGRDQCCAGRAAGETSAVRAGLLFITINVRAGFKFSLSRLLLWNLYSILISDRLFYFTMVTHVIVILPWVVLFLFEIASPRPSPRLASPRLASPRLASPRLASPRLASPRLASPRLASPRLASPRLASPRLASPRLASPRLASPRYFILLW